MPKFTLCGILPISQSTAIKLCLKSIPGDLFVSDTSKHSPSNPPLNPPLKIPKFSPNLFISNLVVVNCRKYREVLDLLLKRNNHGVHRVLRFLFLHTCLKFLLKSFYLDIPFGCFKGIFQGCRPFSMGV